VAAEVPLAQVWAIDGDALMVRPGPRLVEGVEQLAAILHPEARLDVPPGRMRATYRLPDHERTR